MPDARSVYWTIHAERRLQERPELSREMVEAAVRAPDACFRAVTHANRWIAHQAVQVAGKPYLLRVFYDMEPGGVAVVVSCYVTSDVERYGRLEP
ncbi:MAG: hypothetical protein KGJ86_00565 [Chloroflexota bacterium]|nr:hypothetical protein [Chloroflexota bacterium]